MNKSDSIVNLALALSKAQVEMPAAVFNAQNPFLKNKYANLGAVIEGSRHTLAKWGLSIAQFPATDFDGRVGITSILMHESGEFIEETVLMPLTEEKGVNIAQVAGRNITYLRRYSWASILGMISEEDTDGELNQEANQKVEKVMKESRVWSIDAMEAAISQNVGVSNHEEAAELLNFSVMPDTAPLKTVNSWLKRFAEAEGDTMLQCADVANNAYMKAKKGSK